MIGKILDLSAEAAMNACIFLLTFLLATGLTCNGKKASCDQPRDEAAKVSAP